MNHSADPHTEPGVLARIDAAVAAAKDAAHACRDAKAREHFEYALALLTESWIAESGQEARAAGRVVADVKSATELFAAVFAREEGN